jgi:hypothetical protein
MALFGSDPEYGTVEVTEEWLESGNLSPSDEVNDGLYIMPHEDDGGLDVGKSLLTSLHQPKMDHSGLLGRNKINVSPVTAFEMTYSHKAMGFEFVSRSNSAIKTIEGQLNTLLPNSDYERRDPHLLDFQEGHHVAAAELRLRDYTLLPIRRRDLDGFENDPLGSIAAEMIGLVSDEIPPAEVTVQTVLKPADSDWTNGVNGEGDIGQIAEDLESDNIRHPWHPFKYNVQEPSQTEKKTANLVRNQEGHHGWWFNIRIVASSADPDEAKRRVEKTGNMYKQFYNSESNQGFETTPLSGDGIKECVENAVERKYVRPANPLLKSETELTGLVHIPDGDVTTRDLERATTKGDDGVPPSAPKFKDFDETGYTSKDIPRRSWEQQISDEWDWPYAVTMDDADGYNAVNSHEYTIDAHERGTSGDAYAGAYPRAMIENANYADQPYWVGLDSRNQTVPILHRESFRHTFVTGQTGTGKSTYVLNRLNQHAMKGHGFAFVDPSGEDCFELLKMLPEDRTDDVVFIDITRNDAGEETDDSRHIGFNFLETHHDPGEKGFDAEVEGIISDILPLLEAGEYQRMKGVAANILRALIRANYADTGYTFTLLDMYYILSDEEGRQRYAQFVREEEVDQFLEIFADEVAKLDDSDLEPLIRRLQTWIENAMIRPIVSERNPQFSIADTVEENKILIVKCDTGDDVRQMVSSTITRKVWSVVTARPSRTERFLEGEDGIDVPEPLREASAARGARMDENGDEDLSEDDAGDGTSPKADAGVGEIHVDDLDLDEEGVRDHDELLLHPDGRVEANKQAQAEHDPFYLVIDELHAVLSEESQVDQMLAEARKKRLGLVLLTQQTNQLPDKQRQRIMSNCSTLMAFNPGNDGIERGAIAAGFSGIGKDDLGLDRYHAWTMITDSKGSLSEPFVVQMLPPYPPHRDLADLRDIIDRSLDEYGTEMKSNEEIHGEVPEQFSGGREALGGLDAEDLVDGGIGGTSTDADLSSAEGEQTLYEAIYTVQIRADALGEFVPAEDVKEEWQRRTKKEDEYDSIPSNLIESNTYINQTRRKGTSMLNITHEGLEHAGLTYDTGSSASGGKDDHRLVLQFAHQAFTKMGLKTWLPEQEGDEDPDGLADLPIDPSGASSFRKARELETEAREELIDAVGTDAAVDLTDGRHIAIEAETSTMRAPEQTLTNLRKALDDDRFCVFACKDEHASDKYDNDTFYWPKRGEKIIYETYYEERQVRPNYDKKTFAREIDDDDNRTFYNRKKGYFQIEEDVYALRKRSDLERERGETTEIYWVEDGDEVLMRDRGISDGDGGYEQEPQTHLRFDSQEDVANAERQDIEAYYTYDRSEELYTVRHDGNTEEYESKEQLFDKWARYYPPFLPDVHFPRRPEEDDYAMIVFPDDDNPEYDQPMIYDKGEVRPLLPDEIEMPDVPDAGDVPDAEDGGGDRGDGTGSGDGTGTESDGQAGGAEAIDNERVAELAETVAEEDGVSPAQAREAAKGMAGMSMEWEQKVSMATEAARNITVDSADEGAVNGDDAVSANGSQPASGQSSEAQQGQQGGQSGESPEQPATTDQPASPQSEGDHGQATGGGSATGSGDTGDSDTSGSDDREGASTDDSAGSQSASPETTDDAPDASEASDTPAETDTTADAEAAVESEAEAEREGEPDGADASADDGVDHDEEDEDGDEDEDKDNLTFREQMDQRVAETDETDDPDEIEKIGQLTEVYQMDGRSEIEANRQAQKQVLGEVQYDPHDFPPDQQDSQQGDQPTDDTTDSPTPADENSPESPASPEPPEPPEVAEVDQESAGSETTSTGDHPGDQADDHPQDTTGDHQQSDSPEPPEVAEVDDQPPEESDISQQSTHDDRSPEATTSATSGASTDSATTGEVASEGDSDTHSDTDPASDTTSQNSADREDRGECSEGSTSPDREGGSSADHHGSSTPSGPSQQATDEGTSSAETSADDSGTTGNSQSQENNDTDDDTDSESDESQSSSTGRSPWDA